MRQAIPLETKLEQIRKLTSNIATEDDKHEIGMVWPLNQFEDFNDLIGQNKNQGDLIKYNEVVYMIMQDTLLQEHFKPDGAGMLAIFKPHQGHGECDWLYGEYSVIGDIRWDNGKRYIAIQNPNANIYAPSQVPAIWKEFLDQ